MLSRSRVALCLVLVLGGCSQKRDNPHRHEGPFRELAVGGYFTCGLQRDGTPSCWHEGAAVTALPRRKLGHIAAGRLQACGIDLEGGLECWGDCKECTYPPGTYVDVAVGEGSPMSCAITAAGKATCRGGAAAPSKVSFRGIDVGGTAACGVTKAGEVQCWGLLAYEVTPSDPQSGGRRKVALTPPALQGVEQVAMGRDHACARLEPGSLRCWGLDDLGQASPPAEAAFSTIDAFGGRTCGVTKSREILCWGAPVSWRGKTFAPPAGPFVDVRVGKSHVCGLTPEESITCWGVDQQGQVSGKTDLIRN